jgi:hypothetical protein
MLRWAALVAHEFGHHLQAASGILSDLLAAGSTLRSQGGSDVLGRARGRGAWWAKLDRQKCTCGPSGSGRGLPVRGRTRADRYTRSRRLPGARQASSPVAISTIVGDIVHNLRSALDSLAYEIAVRHVGRPLEGRGAELAHQEQETAARLL